MFQQYEQLEQQIAEHQAKIEELQEQMAQAERIKEGVIAFDKALVNLAAEYRMEEEDFFAARGDLVVEWLVSQLNEEGAPDYIQTLKSRVARHLKREGARPAAAVPWHRQAKLPSPNWKPATTVTPTPAPL